MILFRLAQFIGSQGCLFLSSGSIPLIQSFSVEILLWCWYLFGYMILFVCNWFVSRLDPLLLVLSLYGMNFDTRCNRKVSRSASCLANGLIVDVFDARLVVFSAFMSYPWWAAILNSNAR